MLVNPLALNNHYIFFRFITTALNLFSPILNYIRLNGRYGLELNVHKLAFINCVRFLKNHFYFSFKTISDLVGIDYPSLALRFKVVYIFLSYTSTFRLLVSVNVRDRLAIDSLTKMYPGCGWLEREVWDFFGIYFQGNRDLRRILTDYGFTGYPLRKDFPLTGFSEVLFDDKRHQVIYQQVSLAQEYRDFTHQNPWRLN